MLLENNKLRLLGLASGIVVLNKAEKNNLIKLGIEAKNIRIRFIGVDRSKFKRDNLKITNEKSVILVSQYHPRKNLEPLNQLVQDFSDWAFTLVGTGWETSGILANLRLNKNFTYVNFNKETYPNLLGSNKFFLSLSNIEGGPIPLIESMETGLIPLATRTGWSVDLLDPMYSYHLLNIPVDINEVKNKLFNLSASDSINFDTVLNNISYDGFIRDLIHF
jgi:glycosyltransferase involved in cell wall biosynthesis